MKTIEIDDKTYDLVQAVRRKLSAEIAGSNSLTLDGVIFGLAYREFVNIVKVK